MSQLFLGQGTLGEEATHEALALEVRLAHADPQGAPESGIRVRRLAAGGQSEADDHGGGEKGQIRPSMRMYDVVDATRRINLAPERLRNWEWWQLVRRLDQSRKHHGVLRAVPDE